MQAPGVPKWLILQEIAEVGNGRLGGLLAGRVPAQRPGTSWSSFCGESGGKEPALSALAPRLFSGNVSMKQVNSAFGG